MRKMKLAMATGVVALATTMTACGGHVHHDDHHSPSFHVTNSSCHRQDVTSKHKQRIKVRGKYKTVTVTTHSYKTVCHH